jgi:hypothetical protein
MAGVQGNRVVAGMRHIVVEGGISTLILFTRAAKQVTWSVILE